MAGLIPDEILREIMNRCDIVDIVGEYVPLRRRGRNWFGLCPFHQEDTPSFSVSQDKQLYKCFGCGKGGNVIGFVQEVDHLSFGEAARKLADRAGLTIPEEQISPEERKRQQQRQSLLRIHQLAADFYKSNLSGAALAYLDRRGVSPAVGESFGLGYSPEADWQALPAYLTQEGFGESIQLLSGLVSKSAKTGKLYDKFHGRLIFPIRDNRGQVVAFGGRVLGKDEPKYLNSQTTPIYNKSQLLYGLDLAASSIARNRQAVIMEGYMDVITAHQYGVDNAVASLGTAFTQQQAQLLRRLAPAQPEKMQVLLSFDGDGAGAKAALQSLEKLNTCSFAEPRVLVYPEKMDPDEFLHRYGNRGWQRLLERSSYPTLDYLLLRSMGRHDISTAAGKGAVVADMRGPLRAATSVTERDSFISQMARKLSVPEHSIRADLSDNRSRKAEAPLPVPKAPAEKNPEFPRWLPELLVLSISDPRAFALTWEQKQRFEPYGPLPGELLALVKELDDRYDYRPVSLFNYINEENEGLRNFLLKINTTEAPEGDIPRLAKEYLATLHRWELDQRLAELQRLIAAAEEQGKDTADLVRERLRLTQEKKGL